MALVQRYNQSDGIHPNAEGARVVRRALDRATGSNTTGANPSHSTPASRDRGHENRTGTTTTHPR